MKQQNQQHPADHTDKTDRAKKVDKIEVARQKREQRTPDSTTVIKGKWPQQVKAAKNQWGKLSEAELLKSDGDPQQLTGLVQQRYSIERHAAEKQVKSFLDKCNIA
ncbi:hypothetical protein QE250_05610 [Chromatiaceae bacterium AAb-1]|nr:hypothetical protein [Chromatiaceae bacterium AAb-1]